MSNITNQCSSVQGRLNIAHVRRVIMKNRKLSDQVDCPQTKFQRTNTTNQCSSVQGRHNIAYVRWSLM